MKTKTRIAKWLTINGLAALTHAERRHIARWMDVESVRSKRYRRHTVYERAAALDAIKAHQKPEADDSGPGIDPVTGLSWSKARLREQTLTARAERDRARALAGGELVPLHVLEQAVTMAEYRLNRLITADFYNLGGRRLTEQEEAVARRAVKEAIADLRAFVEQTVARRAEIAAEKGQQ